MATTWSTTNHGGGSLTNANLTALAGVGAGNGPYNGRCDTGIVGLKYWEDTLDVVTSVNTAMGLTNSSWAFADGDFIGGAAGTVGYYGNGQFFVNGSQVATLSTYAQGTVMGWAVNATGTLVWVTTDGVNWNVGAGGSQNPIGNLGGISLAGLGTMMPAYGLWQTSGTEDQVTGNFGATTFAYATLFATLQAAGYSSFDSAGVNTTLTAAEGTYALAGKTVTFPIARNLTAAQGSYALAGKAVSFPIAHTLTAAEGTYALTGEAATLTYTPFAGIAYTLTASFGSYALAGQAANLVPVIANRAAGPAARRHTGPIVEFSENHRVLAERAIADAVRRAAERDASDPSAESIARKVAQPGLSRGAARELVAQMTETRSLRARVEQMRAQIDQQLRDDEEDDAIAILLMAA